MVNKLDIAMSPVRAAFEKGVRNDAKLDSYEVNDIIEAARAFINGCTNPTELRAGIAKTVQELRAWVPETSADSAYSRVDLEKDIEKLTQTRDGRLKLIDVKKKDWVRGINNFGAVEKPSSSQLRGAIENARDFINSVDDPRLIQQGLKLITDDLNKRAEGGLVDPQRNLTVHRPYVPASPTKLSDEISQLKRSAEIRVAELTKGAAAANALNGRWSPS